MRALGRLVDSNGEPNIEVLAKLVLLYFFCMINLEVVKLVGQEDWEMSN